MREAGAQFAALDAAALHALRRRAKRLRYAAEFFAPLLPDRPTHKLIARLGDLQDRMGRVNDAAVAATLLDQLGSTGASWAGGAVSGALAMRADKARRRSAKAWAKFAKLDLV